MLGGYTRHAEPVRAHARPAGDEVVIAVDIQPSTADYIRTQEIYAFIIVRECDGSGDGHPLEPWISGRRLSNFDFPVDTGAVRLSGTMSARNFNTYRQPCAAVEGGSYGPGRLTSDALPVVAGATAIVEGKPATVRSPAPTRSTGVVIDLERSDDHLLVRVENQSAGTLVISDEAIVGFGIGEPRLALVVSVNADEVIPCAHLDPPSHGRPAIELAPGRSTEKSVPVPLVAKIYCLRPGIYDVRAEYRRGSAPPIASRTITLQIGDD